MFKLFRLLRQESAEFGNQFFLYIVIAGLAQSLLLVVINGAVKKAVDGQLGVHTFFLFLTTLLLYVITQRYILNHFMRIVEGVKENIRVRLVHKVRQADCYKLEKLNQAEIFSTLVKETAAITQLSPRLISGIQSSVMIVCTMVYIAWLSWPAFILVLAAVTVQMHYMMRSDRKTFAAFKKSTEAEVELLDGLTNVVAGFPQIKLSEKKGDSVLADIEGTARLDRELKVSALEKYLNNYVLMLIFFYVLIGVVMFIFQKFNHDLTPVLYRLVTTMLFLIEPLWNLVELSAKLSQVGVSADNFHELEHKLDQVNDGIGKENAYVLLSGFDTITFKDVVFEYSDFSGTGTFTVGPINQSFKRGEVVFIVGGNGCGKSTFLKLLCAIYFPQSGRVQLDNLTLTAENVQSYREMFSIIFGNFHLFDKLHGIEKIYPGRVAELLHVFGLEEKTSYKGGRFTSLDLSTGQRKRLAMIISFLENKEICIFDEWAADQDPLFKRYFYEQILLDLKKQGKTVICVTHDDAYFHVADRVLVMESGQFVEETVPAPASQKRRRSPLRLASAG
jgi:putative ATP-binding cassette transporter